MFGRVHGLVWCFSNWKSLTCWNQVRGDWKRLGCHGNIIFNSVFVRHVELLACQVSLLVDRFTTYASKIGSSACFHFLSKVFRICFNFALLRYAISLKSRATLSSNQKQNQNQAWLAHTRWTTTLCDWFKISRDFVVQSELRPKPIVTRSHTLDYYAMRLV